MHDLISFVRFKKRQNIHGGVLLLVKLQVLVCNFAKSITPPWDFHVFKIVQMVPNLAKASHIKNFLTIQMRVLDFLMNHLGCCKESHGKSV